MFAQEMDPREKRAKMHILDDLIGYMRKLELGKDESDDPLKEGLEMAEDKMDDREERGMEDQPEGMDVEIEKPEMGEEVMEEEPEEEKGPEMSPFQKEMKDYFNNTDRPKVGTSMSFMVESKKPGKKMVKDVEKMAFKKKKGRPFKG